jgi:acyl carrier protein
MSERDLDDLEREIRGAIAAIIEVAPEAIGPDTHLVQDLGADSMAALEIMAWLEKTFRVVIEPEALPEMTTLARIAGLVRKLSDAV